jgi:hypothetical protein
MSGIIGGVGSKSGVIGETEIDYEEGTWTPVITRVDSNPSGTPSVAGNYIKTGKLVYVEGYAQLNGYSGGSGQWQCTLPFTASANIHHQAMGKARIYMSGDSNDRQFRVHQSTNLLRLWIPSSDTVYNSTISYLIWYFSGSYTIA